MGHDIARWNHQGEPWAGAAQSSRSTARSIASSRSRRCSTVSVCQVQKLTTSPAVAMRRRRERPRTPDPATRAPAKAWKPTAHSRGRRASAGSTGESRPTGVGSTPHAPMQRSCITAPGGDRLEDTRLTFRRPSGGHREPRRRVRHGYELFCGRIASNSPPGRTRREQPNSGQRKSARFWRIWPISVAGAGFEPATSGL